MISFILSFSFHFSSSSVKIEAINACKFSDVVGERSRGNLQTLIPEKGSEVLEEEPRSIEMDLKAEAAAATNLNNDNNLGRGCSIPKMQNRSPSQISHLAIDIGGSLIKLVYLSRDGDGSSEDETSSHSKERTSISNGDSTSPLFGGRLRLAKFETSKIGDCIEFIRLKQLHFGGCSNHKCPSREKTTIKATGGGAFKFADLFKEKLGISFDKKEEMECLVAGANFLLKTVHQESFTYMDGQKEFVQINHNDLFPYLLVNIGSGVSMIKVDGDGKFERVSGTSVGGGTFLGLGRLLTKCRSFNELLELSHQGNNRVIDMLVGDIYGGMDYSKIGLASTAIASSFGKAISEDRELEEYKPEDITRSLLRMISNNIGQIAYLNALRYGLKRIIFGGFFLRGHSYTMDTISVAVNFWSKGEARAIFLRHEGFLGALGAFTGYKMHSHESDQSVQSCFTKASCIDGKLYGALSNHLKEDESMECRVHTYSI